MNNSARVLAFVLANLTAFSPVAAALAATPADTTSVLVQDIKTFQTNIDSGSVKPADAIDQFSKAIVDHKISVDDVSSFVKSQMTTEQYTAYQTQVNSALRGVDPSTLTPEETGQLVGQALAQIHTEGLYWDGCEETWTGAAIAVAAIVVGVISIGKDKSTSAIETDYQNKIASSNNSYSSQITATNNWQTAFPAQISSDESDIHYQNDVIANASAQASSYTALYNEEYAQGTVNSSLQTEINNDENEIENANAAISADVSNIQFLQSKITIYTANPGQAAIDAQTLAQQKVSTAAQLQAEENAAVAAAPANQKLGLEMGIGAGIGAAVSAVLLVNAYERDGMCGLFD